MRHLRLITRTASVPTVWRVPFHLTVVAESDSYLKWAAGLVGQLPAGTRRDVLLSYSPVRPSASQQAAALAGTSFAGRELTSVSPGQFVERVSQQRPDAVLLACTGPTAHAYQEALSRAAHRPVVVAGIPGIALPARRRAWGYRGAVDLLVVHSRREVREYELVRCLTGRSGRIGLATLPFLPALVSPDETPGSSETPGASGAGRVPQGGVGHGRAAVPGAHLRPGAVVFATQAKVPRLPEDRVAILRALDDLAGHRPDLDIVIKTRGEPGETHTHYESHHYAHVLRSLKETGRLIHPDRLVLTNGPMAEHLDRATALVTVSSTAALEAIGRGLPVLLVDDFGVGDQMINEVFVGSGCLAGLDAVAKGAFRHADPEWLDDNYFHPAHENTWVEELFALRERAAARRLPPLASGLDPTRSPRRRRRDRLRLTRLGSVVARRRRQLRHLAGRARSAI